MGDSKKALAELEQKEFPQVGQVTCSIGFAAVDPAQPPANSFFLKKFDNGFIKSVNAEFTYEFGSSTTDPSSTFSQDNYLAGVGLDFNIPGMDFFKATIYHAWDRNTFGRGEDEQLTLSYGWHHGQVTVDGFLDFTPSKGSNH